VDFVAAWPARNIIPETTPDKTKFLREIMYGRPALLIFCIGFLLPFEWPHGDAFPGPQISAIIAQLLTAVQHSGSMATAADRILEERMDDRQGEVVLSGSRGQPSSSSKRSCDPSPDGSSCGWLPAVWGRGLAVHKTPPRRQQERDRHPRKYASPDSSGSTAARAASRVDVSLARTR